ncbi:MAG TPA: hypothetical protein VNZ58_04195 [Thermomicrobiales bacterium]|nr:hypothetical protein [Thermomicrobiales bacterium]
MAFVLRKTAPPGAEITPGKPILPVAPGAVTSPQIPGQVPDRSSVPGENQIPVPPPPAGGPRRPLVERETAQGIMHVYAPKNGNEDDPARFEQATVSYEEIRKAVPFLRTPIRPAAGYALADGTRVSNSALAALSSRAQATREPAD